MVRRRSNDVGCTPIRAAAKRSLERELAGLRVAVNYLLEDSGVSADGTPTSSGSSAKGPVPNPPEESPLGEPQKIVPPSAKKPVPAPEPK